jgi:UDP-N-acetyl-D-mannosaminuronate dehydrogenase
MPILKHATEFNERRPYNKASEIVQNYPMANTFLIIGCAFKQGESVTEHSPGLKLAEILQKEFMKKVLVHDPLVTQTEFENADLNNWTFDIVVIAVRQKCIDYDSLTQKCDEHNTPMISFDALQY